MVNSDTDPIQELHNHLALLMTVIEKGFQRVQAGQKKALDGMIELHGEALAIRHTTDAMISADDVRLVIVQAVQELASGSTALALPDHFPTGAPIPEISPEMRQWMGRVEGILATLLKVTPAQNPTPQKQTVRSTPYNSGDDLGDDSKVTRAKLGDRVENRPLPRIPATPASKANVGQGTIGDDLGDGKKVTPKSSPTKSGDGKRSTPNKSVVKSGDDVGDVRGRVIEYYSAHPTHSLQQIATAVGTNKSYVGRIVTSLKKQKTGKK